MRHSLGEKPFVTLHGWLHDHDGAYRHAPTGDPKVMLCVLPTKNGRVIFQHLVLNFGGRASVWGYNRIGDFLIAVALLLLGISADHFVDDYCGYESNHSAGSAFESFRAVSCILGYPTKKSKEQPPDSRFVLLGVVIFIDGQVLWVKPKPE